MGLPVLIGGDNLPSPVEIGLTELPNIGGPVAPLSPSPGSGITAFFLYRSGFLKPKVFEKICRLIEHLLNEHQNQLGDFAKILWPS